MTVEDAKYGDIILIGTHISGVKIEICWEVGKDIMTTGSEKKEKESPLMYLDWEVVSIETNWLRGC